MSPIQQMLLGVGAVATKTYVDDIFSTFLYTGTGSARSINNGIDLSGEGGMVWLKARNGTNDHVLNDTVRGAGNRLRSNVNAANVSSTAYLSAFNNNGFSVGTDSDVNGSGKTLASWTFRKAPGFFTIKQYTGTGSTQSLTHDLGSIPGMMIVKKTSGIGNWAVYHRAKGANYITYLNLTSAGGNSGSFWWNTEPTSTHFTVGNDADTNASGATYVAYLFAGGESTAATARSVDFDSSQEDALTTAHSSDFDFGSGDFTVEAWIKPTNASQVDPTPVSVWNFPDGRRSWAIFGNTGGAEVAFDGSIRAAVSPDGQFATRTEISGTVNLHQWNHVAFTRSSNTLYFFINGVLQGTASFTGSVYSNTSDGIMIGGMGDSADIRNEFDGSISNVRVVKGTAVYTSSFRPTYEPLTNITNTKLLCCNNSSTTGSTVTPGTITAHNSPTASTDSPFDDPAGFVFGDAGDQNVIKCGSYVGNGSSDGQSIFLGFEPQFIIQKNASANTGGTWNMYDSMRGVVTGGNDRYFRANTNQTAGDADLIEFTPTGFNVIGNASNNNGSGVEFIYIAIRRSDGYCGKPPELGNQAFTPVFGSANAPLFKANNHVVDFTLQKNSNFATQSADWNLTSRLTSGKLLKTNSFDAESSNQYQVFDYQSGTSSFTGGSGIRFGWLWKRNAGMDVICYEGTHVNNLNVSHSLNAVPEMMIIKNREAQENWAVYHKGLNGGTNPQNYFIWLNSDGPETDHHEWWNDTAPTSTHFTVGTHESVNPSQQSMIAMLFRSVSGISAVGSYSGSGSTGNSQNIGFQPRFLIIRRASVKSNGTGDDWFVFDSVNGFDKYLILNKNQQRYSQTYVNVSSTGFSLVSDYASTNESGANYIYYAHA